MELSGGQFLPPVQALVATLIFAQRAKMHIESYIVHQPFSIYQKQRRGGEPPRR
jgi:hypothetical protein